LDYTSILSGKASGVSISTLTACRSRAAYSTYRACSARSAFSCCAKSVDSGIAAVACVGGNCGALGIRICDDARYDICDKAAGKSVAACSTRCCCPALAAYRSYAVTAIAAFTSLTAVSADSFYSTRSMAGGDITAITPSDESTHITDRSGKSDSSVFSG
jgi:hypothetical protein